MRAANKPCVQPWETSILRAASSNRDYKGVSSSIVGNLPNGSAHPWELWFGGPQFGSETLCNLSSGFGQCSGAVTVRSLETAYVRGACGLKRFCCALT